MSISALSSSQTSSAWSNTASSTRSRGPSFEQLFSKIDVNGDGNVDKAELTQAFSSSSSSSTSDSTSIDNLFSSLDTNSDNSVSADELGTALKSLADQLDSQFQNRRLSDARAADGSNGPPPPPNSDELFAKTDANGDGVIDKSELTTALANGPQNGNTPNVDELFKKLDADGDGKITASEQKTGLESLHSANASNSATSTVTATSSSSDTSSTSSSANSDKLLELIASLLEQYKSASSFGTNSQYSSLLSTTA